MTGIADADADDENFSHLFLQAAVVLHPTRLFND
jgi:hypothetical protein